MRIDLPNETVLHRIGGASIENLRLSSLDASALPPGLSVLLGGTPHEAAEQLRQAFASRKWQTQAGTVATATVEDIRRVGFDVIEMKTQRLPNHGRIIHPDGVNGFSDLNLRQLASVFRTTYGC